MEQNIRLEFDDIRQLPQHYAGEDIEGVEIRFEWEVPRILLASIDSGDDIWGLERHACILQDSFIHDWFEATTCEEYITSTWGMPLSLIVFDLMKNLQLELLAGDLYFAFPAPWFRVLFGWNAPELARSLSISGTEFFGGRGKILGYDIPSIDGAHVDFFESDVVLHFQSIGDVQHALGFIEIWDWLCKAVRLVPKQTSLSRPKYISEISTSRKLTVSSHLHWESPPKTDDSCWKLLFQACTVVPSALKRRSEQCKGLVLPFSRMVSLAATEFQLIVDGGVVFVGYRTILYPTAIHGDSVQFHLLTEETSQINPYLVEYGSRVLTEDASQFLKMRCFLGWCTEAHINLGTEKLQTLVRTSNGKGKEKSLALDGYTTVTQVGASAPLSAIVGLQTDWKLTSHRHYFDTASNYKQLLRETARKIALAYDSTERRSWLVPKLSLLLHMCQAYALHCGCPKGRVPLVQPHSDATLLENDLEKLGSTPVIGDGEDALLFHQLMLGLNINLLKTRRLVKESVGRKLYGFEFRDIITQPGRGSCMKQLTLDLSGKSWIGLANEVDAIIVCAGLGDAITAADTARIQNGQCDKVPQGHDYLASTVNCLKRLTEGRESTLASQTKTQSLQISDECAWSISVDPFSTCNHSSSPGECWQNSSIFQHLIPVRPFFPLWKLRDRPPASSGTAIPIPDSGAVVFGT